MKRQKKEIRAAIVPPECERARQQFHKRMGDFYAARVEQQLLHLPKEQKLKVIDSLMASAIQ